MTTALLYRMQGGFPGDVNRTHPASIVPALNDASTPVLTAGLVAMFNGASDDVRSVATGDAQSNGTTTLRIAGVTVRSYPIQQPTAAVAYAPAAIGAPEPLPAGQYIDVLDDGFIMGVVVGTPNKGDPVYIWASASSGAHIQGGFEASSSGTNTFGLDNAYFNGPPDSLGNVEVRVRAP